MSSPLEVPGSQGGCDPFPLSGPCVSDSCCLLSYLEGEEGEDTCTITQADIAAAVDLAAGAKVGRSAPGFGEGNVDPDL